MLQYAPVVQVSGIDFCEETAVTYLVRGEVIRAVAVTVSGKERGRVCGGKRARR